MSGILACRRLQMGKETTQGDLVAATSIWRGKGTILTDLSIIFPEEDIGVPVGTDRSLIAKKGAVLTLDSVEATYEQLPYLFEMGVASATPTTDADSAGIWVYDPPVATTDWYTSTDLATYTWEGGDNEQEEEFGFGHARSITLSGTVNEPVKMGAEVIGREVAKSTFTPALSVPSVTDILFTKGVIYADAVGDSIGTTQLTNTWLMFSLSYTTGWVAVLTADGRYDFSFIKMVRPEAILTVEFEHNATAISEKDYWIAQTARQLRMNFTMSAGNYLEMDMAGKWDNFEKLGERDGNDILRGNFRIRYNSTAGLYFKTTIASSTLAALP